MRKFINFLIKREQSRTGSGFAECEKSRLKAKLTMTLALLIMAVGGAWAQSTFGVKEITADMLPASWSTDNSAVTADDLAKLGFMEVTKDAAKTWTGAPQEGTVRLIYTLCESVNWVNGQGGSESTYSSRKVFYSCLDGQRIFITTELTEWSLTPDADKKVWTLPNMPANNIELQVEYEPAMLTLAASPADGGKVELDAAAAPVEWTPETWTNVSTQGQHDALTSGDITLSTTGWLVKASDGNLTLYSADNEYDHQTLTFSTTGDGFTCIELTMTSDASNHNPHITPADGWTFSGKSAVWEGEATKSLVCQNCTTTVSKITFFKGAVPDGVTVNGDGTFTVAKTATVTLTATPAEGYKFLYWDDDQNNTNPVREVTIEPGEADKTYKAVFEEITYNVTFADGIEDADKWKAEPNAAAKNTEVKVTYSGAKKVLGVKVEKKAAAPKLLTLNVGGDYPGTLTYAEGETWGQAIQNHPTENTGWEIGGGGAVILNTYYVYLEDNRVRQGDAITPGLGYYTE